MRFNTALEFNEGGVQTSLKFEFQNVGNAPTLHVGMEATDSPAVGAEMPKKAAVEFFDL